MSGELRPQLVVLGLLLCGCSESKPGTGKPPDPVAVSDAEDRASNLATLGQQARQAKEAEDWESARQTYLEALEVAPGHPVVYERIAEVEVRLGLLEEALEHLAAMAALGGTTPQIDEPRFEPLLDHVYVTASPPIATDVDLSDAPPPAIVRLPL